ncbi:N-acetyl sugar amidotransferase [Ruminococcus sp. AF18-22]|nr:N-acetyl sugar amidotransferase [Ruminococcus sp. AF18-22]
MEYRICNRCVMSNKGDDTIEFDDNGICNYCRSAEEAIKECYFPNQEGKAKLEAIIKTIKEERKNEKYDCMIGLSGGLDSSYMAYIGYQYGLRMLAVHIDDGFDIEITKNNISKIAETFHIDLIIEKPNKELFADVTKSFIRAGVPNIAIPQDNVLFATLYKYARENNISYFLSGSNFALESILQKGNTYDASDKKHIMDIHKKYGDLKLNKELPLISIFDKRIKYEHIYKIKTLKLLNYIDYNAHRALHELEEACGFEYYGDKHCESVFTKFMQRYYLPVKFGVDKRTSHYSSMILSGQMTREKALEELERPLYKEGELEQDITYILTELGMSREEFDKIMSETPNSHDNFKKSLFNKLIHLILKFRKY